MSVEISTTSNIFSLNVKLVTLIIKRSIFLLSATNIKIILTTKTDINSTSISHGINNLLYPKYKLFISWNLNVCQSIETTQTTINEYTFVLAKVATILLFSSIMQVACTIPQIIKGRVVPCHNALIRKTIIIHTHLKMCPYDSNGKYI